MERESRRMGGERERRRVKGGDVGRPGRGWSGSAGQITAGSVLIPKPFASCHVLGRKGLSVCTCETGPALHRIMAHDMSHDGYMSLPDLGWAVTQAHMPCHLLISFNAAAVRFYRGPLYAKPAGRRVDARQTTQNSRQNTEATPRISSSGSVRARKVHSDSRVQPLQSVWATAYGLGDALGLASWCPVVQRTQISISFRRDAI